MADVFQSAPMSYGGGFRSDLGMLETTDGISGILMQNIQVTYQRPITKIYELGNKNTARPPLLAAAGAGTNLFMLQIEFLQMVNTVQYSLKNGAYNALSVVEVA